MSRYDKALRLLTHVGLVLLTTVILYPVILVVKKAFEPGAGFATSLSPVPSQLTGENFSRLFSGDHGFFRFVFNSGVVALATTVVGICLAATAGYALSRFRFAGRKVTLTSFLAVQMFPGTLLLMPLYVLLNRLGLLNSLFGLVLVYATTAIPFCVWTLKGYFDNLPRELEEAALMDGASTWTIFFKIMLPLARPGLAVTGLFSFMTAWNEFILASTFLTDDSSYTLPVLLNNFVGRYFTDWGLFAAGAVITSIPVMVLFYLLQKSLVGGITSGSIKG